MSDERWEREADPEVAEDELLRRRTMRDKTRTGDPGPYVAPRILTQVPCRGCPDRMADWTAEAQHAFDTNNSILARLDLAPLDITRIAFCDVCRAKGIAMQADRNRKAADMMRDLIRQLKASSRPDDEQEIQRKLMQLHHPDVKGLVDAIRTRQDGKSRRVRSGDVLYHPDVRGSVVRSGDSL